MKAKNKNLLIVVLLLYSFKIILVAAANHENYANSTYHFQGKNNVDQFQNLLAGAYCGDDHFFTFYDNKKCSYILEKKSVATKRRLNLCKDTNINNACKWSCGHCSDSIVDDPNYKIVKYNGDQKPCQWISKHNHWLTRQNRRNKYCPKWFDGRKVSDACKLSCANYIIPKHREQRRKLGYISSTDATRESFKHFENVASWTYNFKTTLPVDQGIFADEHGIEYVPMIAKPYLVNKNCEFEEGFNEPYKKSTQNYIEPEKAVEYWTKFLQPAAKANNLELITPTTKWNDNCLTWLANFLRICFDNRPDCDVEMIHAFNLHQYKCEENLWKFNHAGHFTRFEDRLISFIGKDYGGKDWKEYVANRNVWVTETHCGRAYDNDLLGSSSDEICEKITGQRQGYGRGSIFAMESLPQIERYAWWTTFNSNSIQHKYSNNYLTYEDGQLTPAGRGILDPTNFGNVDCHFRGTRVLAENATLTGEAKLFKCNETGTYMIKNIGKSRGTATFKVYVAKTGKYTMNVSLMSVEQDYRDLHVSVNGGLIQKFPIWETVTRWCFKGGKPVVLPIELKSWFKANETNTVTFGLVEKEDPTNIWDPIIERIQVVPKE